MCTVSNIGAGYGQTFPWTDRPYVQPNPGPTPFTVVRQPTWLEFEELKREVAALKRLLKEAKDYDKTTGQPDCEMDEKVALIKGLADLVGISMEDVFDK